MRRGPEYRCKKAALSSGSTWAWPMSSPTMAPAAVSRITPRKARIWMRRSRSISPLSGKFRSGSTFLKYPSSASAPLDGHHL
ncbi:Uncharacterised protein [Mycobacteroides abscessus subsp. abscessus]|nr:Uncharacterised protein [Mycobacteroides abscessus subsp. abscessus]